MSNPLEAGLDGLGMALPCDARAKLAAYVDLLAKWNATFNLTAIRDRQQMVSHHLLDSLECCKVYRSRNPA
jgi:16S rRNA (guanine527-N7)-methyltransferase